MKIPMPLDADQIAILTGGDKYASQYRNITRTWQLKGSRLTVSMLRTLYRLDLSSTEPESMLTVRVLNSVEKVKCSIKIKEVFFHPLKSKLEIITSE